MVQWMNEEKSTPGKKGCRSRKNSWLSYSSPFLSHLSMRKLQLLRSSDHGGGWACFHTPLSLRSKSEMHLVGESVATGCCTGDQHSSSIRSTVHYKCTKSPVRARYWSYAVRRSYLARSPASTMHSAWIAEMAMHDDDGPVNFERWRWKELTYIARKLAFFPLFISHVLHRDL